MSGWLRGPRDRVALAFGDRAVRYGELARLVDAARSRGAHEDATRGNAGAAGRKADAPGAGPFVAVPAGSAPVDAVVAVLAGLARGVPVVVGADASAAASFLTGAPAGTELVLTTSGSSGAGPRAVRRTDASWLASAAPLAEAAGLGPGDAAVVAITGPLHVSMHLYAVLHALWLGATATDRRAAATVAHATPTTLARLVDEPAPPPHVIVAGAATDRALHERASARGIRLTEYYGAAELSFVAVGRGEGLRPFPGVEVELRPTPAGRELWARSPYLALDVAGAPGAMRRDARGFATVGDLAAPLDDGAFRVAGRGDAAITTAGTTVLAEDVEARLAAVPGIAAAAVLGMPDRLLGERLIAVVELAAEGPGDTALPQSLLEASRSLPPAWRPRRWYRIPVMPRTDSGKLARGRVRAELEAGRLDELASVAAEAAS
ncbi:AMP-binding enzyme [Agromyces soli]